MKIVCENCGAKYSIADEKIKGKIFKIRCKKCNESIVIRGDAPAEVAVAPEPAAAAPPPMPAADAGADDGDAETRVFDYSGYQQGGASAGGEAVWHIVVEGNQQGPYTTGQIKEYLAGGNLDWETFIWREGFDDWKPIREVADFGSGGGSPRAQAAPAARPVAAAPAAQSPFGGGGLFDAPAAGGGGLFDAPATGGGGLFDAPASGGGGLFDTPAAASPAAAGKAGGLFDTPAAGGGLFGGGAQAATPGDVFSSTGSPGAAADGGGLFGGGGSSGGGLFDSAEGSGDLFGEGHDADTSGGGIFSSAGAGAPAAASPRVSAAQSMMTGQRNENSVLFSLSNLQALASAEAPVAKSSAGGFSMGGEASGLIDIRSMASSMGGPEKTGLDDLISIGGGGFAPSLGAPVLAAQHTGMSFGAKIGIIGGGVAVLAAAVIVAVVLLQPEEPKAPAIDPQVEALQKKLDALMAKGGSAQDVADAQKKLEKAEQDQTGTGGDTIAEASGAGKVDDGGKKAGGDTGSKPKKGGGSKDKGDTKAAGGGAGAGGGGAGGAETSDTGSKPKKGGGVDELDDLLGGSGGGAAKKPKEEPKSGGAAAGGSTGGAAAGGGGAALPAKLGRDQVQSGMNAVSGAVSKCGQGQTGTVMIQATIAPTGRVTSAAATGSFAGTPAGLCAARAVRGARFPQTQSSLTVTYPFKF